MNKKIITGLIVLMAISIVGIITVQLVWMNNALKVKNELFNRGVNEALTNTVRKLEDIHNFGVVNQMAFNDSVSWVFETDEDFNGNMKLKILSDEKHSHKIIQHNNKPPQVKIIRGSKPGSKNRTIEIRVESDTNSSTNSFSYNIDAESIKTDEFSKIIIFQNDTIISAADSLYTISMIKIDSVLTHLDAMTFVQPNITRRAKTKGIKLKSLANQVVTEIHEWDVKEVDPELLHKVLKEELENKNIPINFEFGIIRDSIIDFPIEVIDSANVASTNFQINLYPNDIFQKNLKLALYFPDRDSFVYRSLNWLLITSFLFSLFILVTFSLSIFYILRQKKISEMKSDFINNMTHEFKTPIATISVATDSINNEKVVTDPERIRYFTGMIKKENARMNRQVEDILTIARLDKKDFEFNWEAIDVHELINDAIQGINLQVEKQGGSIITNLDANNSMVTTDKMHCTNVVYNLLDNALKYSNESPEISVSTISKSNGILVSVSDKGIGMTKAVQGKIFERFYRQTRGNIHNVKGFGLGLSYVKAVLEANKGIITVQSEPGKGSNFEVFLPFVRE